MTGAPQADGLSSQAMEPQASPPKASIPSAWRVGPVVTRHPNGASYVLAGWVRGHFGLDYRFDDENGGAWVLTHMPTGYAAFAIQEPLQTAQALADEVADWGDWDFTDPTETKRFKGRLAPLRQRYRESIQPISCFPLRTFMVAVRADGEGQ